MTPEQYVQLQRRALGSMAYYVANLLGLLTVGPSPAQWAAFVQALYPVVYRGRMDAYRIAERFYASERQRQTGDTTAPRVLARNYGPEDLRRSLDEMVRPYVGQAGTQQPTNLTLARQMATEVTQMHARNGGREAIVDAARHDREAEGYARVAMGETCGFCLLLVSRGPVYKSASKALMRNGTSEPYHPKCDCIAVPVFDRADWAGKDQYEQMRDLYQKVTKGTSGTGSLNAFRDAIEKRESQGQDLPIAA